MSDRSNYLRPDEAALYLHVSKSSLAKWRVYGTGPAFTKAGRVVLYAQADLDQWLTDNRRRSTSETPGTGA